MIPIPGQVAAKQAKNSEPPGLEPRGKENVEKLAEGELAALKELEVEGTEVEEWEVSLGLKPLRGSTGGRLALLRERSWRLEALHS